jgi:hypothetical protein
MFLLHFQHRSKLKLLKNFRVKRNFNNLKPKFGNDLNNESLNFFFINHYYKQMNNLNFI